ncbi:hypothetical protein K7640_09195 [Micromonospora sp. PLK6-60]|nr:hypothetical protein [Micromonospora sp. PLK6-60]
MPTGEGEGDGYQVLLVRDALHRISPRAWIDGTAAGPELVIRPPHLLFTVPT